MRTLKKTRNRLITFRRNEDGILTVEAIMIFPLLLFAVTSAFVVFEGFRQSASNLKAAYTLGDLVSRETQTITETYVDSLHELMEAMIKNQSELKLRLSLIVYDEEDDRHYVRWSTTRGYDFEWTDDNIGEIRSSLPPMPNQDTLILVETSNEYVPVRTPGYGIGTGITFDNFVFTRPRFTNEVAGAV